MYQLMIVDDEIMSQEIISNYIKSNLPAYQITHVCSNGADALACFRQKPVDLVLVDIRMPVMDGIAFIEELNRLTSDCIPIIISGYAEFEYTQSAMKLGVNHYLLKPLDFLELERSLSAAAHSLNSRRQLLASLNVAEDNQEIFFTQLLLGSYQTKDQALIQFSSLRFPFSYDACSGICLQIRFHSLEPERLELDPLYMGIKNLLHLLFSARYLVLLSARNSTCRYLLITDHLADSRFEELRLQALQLLGIEITVEPLLSFSSLEELRTKKPDFLLLDSRPANPPFSLPGEPVPFLSVLDEPGQKSTAEAIQSSIEQAIVYMKEHFAEDLTREAVAEKVYMSGAHFSRCFKLVMRTSYKDYLTEIRMQKAIELLKTNCRIQDIARQVGYPNPNRFNINFRQYTSYTPSEYRRQVLKLI